MVNRGLLITGAFLAMTAVMAGAFGAHGLKDKLSPEMLDVYKTAAQYQMYHALGLILVSMLSSTLSAKMVKVTGFYFIIGVILFSGSLYGLTLSNLKILGAITPVGGVAFLLGWIHVMFGAVQLGRRQTIDSKP